MNEPTLFFKESSRSTPVANKQFRGAMMMGVTASGPQLLMIAKDYDETRLRLDKELGKSETPFNKIPPYPWYFRRRSWPINSKAKHDYVGLRLMQAVTDTPQLEIESILLIEVDFDSPLHPNNQ